MPATTSDSTTLPSAPADRILLVARQQLFAYGYSAFTMDDLAHELGMSKKTLYAHFPSKETIAAAIIDRLGRGIHNRIETVLANTKLDSTQKLFAVTEIVGSALGQVSPALLRNLQRYAPQLYQKIDSIRQKNIPHFFGRLIREGIAEGKVREDIDPAFATEFWLQAIRGLVQPDVLDRMGLTPRQTLEKALHILIGGLLTPSGRKDYEKHLAAKNTSP